MYFFNNLMHQTAGDSFFIIYNIIRDPTGTDIYYCQDFIKYLTNASHTKTHRGLSLRLCYMNFFFVSVPKKYRQFQAHQSILDVIHGIRPGANVGNDRIHYST